MRLKRPDRLVLPLLVAAAMCAIGGSAQSKPPAAIQPPGDIAWAIRRLGRLHGSARRPQGVLRTLEANHDARQPAQSPHRDNVIMFISTRPDEKVKDEVSILVTGYAFKPNTEATATVGGTSFAMYTQNDGAWIKSAADEARLVDAMRKSADTVIKATTSKNTQTTDTFSLKGISQALDRVAQECR
jgi:hypothetical protein